MTKISNPEKVQRAIQLIKEGKTFEQIRKTILDEFSTGISFSTLAELKRQLPTTLSKPIFSQNHNVVDNVVNDSENVKPILRKMIELFGKAIEIKEFLKMLSDDDLQLIDQAEKVLN